MARKTTTGDLFAPPTSPPSPPPTSPTSPPPKPSLPTRSPLEWAVITFAQRYLGRQFTLTDLDNAARRDVPGVPFGAGRKTLAELQAAGVVSTELITAGIWRITAVKP